MNKYNLGLTKTKKEMLDEINSTLTKNTEHYRQLLYELSDVLYDIQANKRLTKRHIDKLREGMMRSWEYVWYYYSGHFVSLMAEDFPECKELFLELWHSKDAKLRQRAIYILDSDSPDSLVEQVVNESKYDRSKWVRSAIAGHIFEKELKQYISELKVRVREEKDDMVRTTLEEMIFFMENGYRLKKVDENHSIIDYKCGNRMIGRMIPNTEIARYTTKEYIETIKTIGMFPD